MTLHFFVYCLKPWNSGLKLKIIMMFASVLYLETLNVILHYKLFYLNKTKNIYIVQLSINYSVAKSASGSQYFLMPHRFLQESSYSSRFRWNGTGICRNCMKSTGMKWIPLKFHWNGTGIQRNGRNEKNYYLFMNEN